ncbi:MULTISPECIES: hypothetical protein [Oceanobacillus]|uniref:LSM domain-containing protein n=1 Tax=Oceanobacillus kimchii TaxID=746691 RepID=A0ABQ5TQ61_9BACI|nr:hypothetical protein [Oceanobacillus kimchii]GLO68357.1 hypothetical protein MACH08_41410 [Oceanobacillus kimchii]GLO68467.1 hypothetical protein MACH08_42510 [Oceanobacillus kimchii]
MIQIINSLNKNYKVSIVYGENGDIFEGYVDSITDDYLIIHEYVSDIYRTLYHDQIIEIQKI